MLLSPVPQVSASRYLVGIQLGTLDLRSFNIFPGHALHEKFLQRQKGVVPLVRSQEQRALLVPVINRW